MYEIWTTVNNVILCKIMKNAQARFTYFNLRIFFLIKKEEKKETKYVQYKSFQLHFAFWTLKLKMYQMKGISFWNRWILSLESDGYLNYVEILYCQFGGNPQMAILAMGIFLLWLCILFIGLAISADDYFCPNLASISKTLRWVKLCEIS